MPYFSTIFSSTSYAPTWAADLSAASLPNRIAPLTRIWEKRIWSRARCKVVWSEAQLGQEGVCCSEVETRGVGHLGSVEMCDTVGPLVPAEPRRGGAGFSASPGM